MTTKLSRDSIFYKLGFRQNTPVTSTAAVAAYYRAILVAPEEKEDYAIVLQQLLVTLREEPIEKEVLLDGTPLVSLGEGFPLDVNAVVCQSCEGRGFRKKYEGFNLNGLCFHCGGEGIVSYPCKRCNKGKINGETCPTCKGTGRFYPRDKLNNPSTKNIPGTTIPGVPCYHCGATGKHGRNFNYFRCPPCGGIGEIKVHNPVLPRAELYKAWEL
jgi:hypothetical protein